MRFDDDLMTGGAISSGAGGVVEDSMMGMLAELKIVDIPEVSSLPRVVMQCMKIGLRALSSMGLLTGRNFEMKAD